MTDHDLLKTTAECAVPVETLVSFESTVVESMGILRKKHIDQKIIYFYVVDYAHRLKGVVSTRQLLLAEPSKKIADIMISNVIKILGTQSMKEAMEVFAKHPLLALPVVDKEGKLLGAIDVQMVIQEPINFFDVRSRSDLFQMIGITLEEKKRVSIFRSYRHRLPWLLCNVFSGLMCAIISRIFELVLSKFILLAFFIPLVLTLSESSAMQSTAQSLQFLRRPRFSWKSLKLRARREWRVIIMIALSLGILVGGLSLFWDTTILPSIAISVGIMGGVSFSAIFGMIVPIVLHRLKLDPKVASGPLVLMMADMLTTAIYLGLATWWLL